VACGLALQGVGLARIRTNLLPPEIRTERIIRAKKPWAAAAAAALLLGTGALATGYAVQLNKTADAQLKAARKQAADAAAAADAQESTIKQKETELEKAKGDVKVIVKGQDERLNWVRLNEVIATALPRHGESGNLDEPAQVPFWSTGAERGERAYKKYLERVRQGLPADRAWEEDMAHFLAQVNVEVINARYTNDVKGFLERADTYVKGKYNDEIFDRWTPKTDAEIDEATKRYKPKVSFEGGAWVIEIRGWTYHEQGDEFIKRTVLRNFQRIGKFVDETGLTPDKKPKIGTFLPGVDDPVKGTLSHAFLM